MFEEAKLNVDDLVDEYEENQIEEFSYKNL